LRYNTARTEWLRSSMAEQLPLKQLVTGSNPVGVTNKKHPNLGMFFCLA
jgi:hypothetical protein